ncbi:MAG TPA: hypothetical protein DEA43_02820 [Candidatus Moranbacteria bacterium]|nr:hypothetical protein [Candidatus Moranbacteria bacterium]HBT45788.1 hypothetical protein [Candidatus Moranbacteria bacterium]
MVANLFEDIMKVLRENDRSVKEIIWAGFSAKNNRGHQETYIGYVDLKIFFDLAKKIPYVGKYTLDQYALEDNLMVVGKDFWLEIYTYAGDQRMLFKEIPKIPINQITPKSLSKICRK